MSDSVGSKWSIHQNALYGEFESGHDHIVVEAVAGSGKTTSMGEGMTRVRRGTIVVCAFNKETASEWVKKIAALRLQPGVKAQAMTTHGLGFRAYGWAMRGQFSKIEVDEGRERKLAADFERAAGETWESEDRNAVLKLVAFAKAWVLFGAASAPRLRRMADHYGVLPTNGKTLAQVVDRAVQVLDASLQPSDTISYDDMVFLPVALGLRPLQFDLVIVDECQDLNRGQMELALMAMKPGGRIFAVGDRRQAIYSWRGADKDSMDRMVKRFGAKTMPLSVTYRCPRAVVAHVNDIVPQIQACDAAPEGVVARVSLDALMDGWQPGDFVLSRTNAPLVKLCVRAWRRNVPAVVLGRDVGRAIRDTIDEFQGDTVEALVAHVVAQGEREVKRLTAANKEERIDAVRDRVETMVALCEGIASMADLRARVNRLFADPERTDEKTGKKVGVDLKSRVVFASTHKAKGLEAPRVWMIEGTYRPGDGEEEDNLYYVAATRAAFRRDKAGELVEPGTLNLVQWDGKSEID